MLRLSCRTAVLPFSGGWHTAELLCRRDDSALRFSFHRLLHSRNTAPTRPLVLLLMRSLKNGEQNALNAASRESENFPCSRKAPDRFSYRLPLSERMVLCHSGGSISSIRS